MSGRNGRSFRNLIVTRGNYGSIVLDLVDNSFHKIPVFSSKVVDTMGAGDAFIAFTAPCVRIGMPIEVVGFIGNAVGALAVNIVGNSASIEPVTLFNFIKTLLK